MRFCVKTHDVELLAGGTTGDNTVPGVIRSHAYLGNHRDYIVDVGQEIPEELYDAVAEVLNFVYQLKESAEKKVVA